MPLGLAIVHAIVVGHGGSVSVLDPAGGGAEFVVSLTASEGTGTAGADDAGPTDASGAAGRGTDSAASAPDA